jgi:hypothetical protein
MARLMESEPLTMSSSGENFGNFNDEECECIALMFGDANNTSRTFLGLRRIGWFGGTKIDSLIPVERDKGGTVWLLTSLNLKRSLLLESQIGETIKDVDTVVGAKDPICSWCSCMIHKYITSFLFFLNLAFSEVLMLMTWFALEIFDCVHSKDFTTVLPICEQYIGCPISHMNELSFRVC